MPWQIGCFLGGSTRICKTVRLDFGSCLDLAGLVFGNFFLGVAAERTESLAPQVITFWFRRVLQVPATYFHQRRVNLASPSLLFSDKTRTGMFRAGPRQTMSAGGRALLGCARHARPGSPTPLVILGWASFHQLLISVGYASTSICLPLTSRGQASQLSQPSVSLDWPTRRFTRPALRLLLPNPRVYWPDPRSQAGRPSLLVDRPFSSIPKTLISWPLPLLLFASRGPGRAVLDRFGPCQVCQVLLALCWAVPPRLVDIGTPLQGGLDKVSAAYCQPRRIQDPC